MVAILSTPPTVNKSAAYGAWMPMALIPPRIADETIAISPQCSPDGKWVVYLRGPSWTPARVNITGEKPPETLSQKSAVYIGDVVAISPDGKRIAYLASPNPPETPGSDSASQPNQLQVNHFGGGAPLR